MAVCVDGQIHIMHEGKPGLVPSYVCFRSDGKQSVGQPPKDLAHLHPLDTVFAVKRIIGRTFDDPVVKQELSFFPFTAVPSNGDLAVPFIMVPHENPRPYFSQNINAIILKTLKTNVEQRFKWRHLLGWRVSKATISISSNFDIAQQTATWGAGKQAGFGTVQLIEGPAAVAFQSHAFLFLSLMFTLL